MFLENVNIIDKHQLSLSQKLNGGRDKEKDGEKERWREKGRKGKREGERLGGKNKGCLLKLKSKENHHY